MKFFSIILFIVLLFSSVNAADVDSLMMQGNQLYQNKQYDEAIQKYQAILDQGYSSAALYYNLGNAYYRSGKLGYAILNYERGLKLEPDNEDLQYNLKIVKARTIDRIKEVPQIFIVDWWVTFITAFSLTTWQVLVIIFYLILLGSVTIFFISKHGRLQRYSVYSALVGLLAAVLFTIVLFANVGRETSKDFAILTTNTVAAKQSPNDSSNDLFVIHEGLKVAVMSQFGDWVEVKLYDGKVGWLPKDALEII
ncbi:Aerotolerance protein BatE [hydrothermal vent metagenome]|uniref:Aerotolerance protein BatE n=1 Tax=hydrothermal vent metagenome TaxID=652676 RepID=A0A3B1CSA7_9ZZZZ